MLFLDEDAGRGNVALAGIRELRGMLEFAAKLAGPRDPTPTERALAPRRKETSGRERGTAQRFLGCPDPAASPSGFPSRVGRLAKDRVQPR